MIRSRNYAWESPLLSRAQEAYQSMKNASLPVLHEVVHSESLLEKAYTHCEEITSVHSRSFHMASALLPPEQRRAARALYAFCRVSDDIVDEAEKDAAERLAQWRTRSLGTHLAADDLVVVAWADARARYHIPWRYAEQLLDGVARDLEQSRYQSFDELATYCYSVASTVGLMSMHIIGFSGEEAIPYAIKLGVALQMTNILRDVGEDWQAGRLYLPLDELEAFDLTESDVAAGQVNERWRNFMRFQIERNRRLYEEAWTGIGMLDSDGRFAIAAAAGLYRAILDDIEAHDYDVFNRRAYVSKWGKLRLLPGLWWRSRRFQF